MIAYGDLLLLSIHLFHRNRARVALINPTQQEIKKG